jgi:hypothetical protein
LLSPLQLGFGIPMGAEAVVHAARSYLYNLEHGSILLKLDYKNAFKQHQKAPNATFHVVQGPQNPPIIFDNSS